MTGNKSYQEFSDEKLLALYRQHANNFWLGILLERYTLLLLGVAMKYLKEKAAAEDAVQQIFLKALTHLPQGEILNFKGWLYILMRNHCLQTLRDRSFHAPEEALQHLVSNDEMEEVYWKDFSLEQMEIALSELNDEQRNTIVLFYLEKKSYQQIVEVTGYSFLQVKSFIQNGKRNLKLILLKKMNEYKA